MATTVTAPLERQFGQLQGLSQMTSTSSGGTSVIVLQFTLSLNIDVAEEEVQSAINASQSYLPVESAGAAGLQQDESRRRAGAHAGDHFRFHAAVASGRSGGYAAGAEDLAAEWRRPGEHQRRAEAGGAHSCQSGGAVFVWHQSGGRAHGADPGERECGEGQLRRAAAGLPDRCERPARQQRRLSQRGGGLPQRRAGHAHRRGGSRRWRSRTTSKRRG